jgi:protein required for attachment to host cells
MNHALVAVIDSIQARFFTLDPPSLFDNQAEPRLTEHETLRNLAQEAQGEELWSSTKTGRNRGLGSQAHSYDDHRERHLTEFERRFAQAIASHLHELIQTHDLRNLIIIAEPQVLGFVREAIATTLPKHISITELGKNLCQLSAHELHAYLQQHGMLSRPSRTSR